jgi:diguanylate cyclase (GGDEF)-like protein/PAS domain S-box-containing protein
MPVHEMKTSKLVSRSIAIGAYSAAALLCALCAQFSPCPGWFNGLLCAALMLAPAALLNFRRKSVSGQHESQISEFVQRLLDVIPEPVYIKDELGRYTFINRAFAQRRHQSPEQILGRSAAELAPNAVIAGLVAQEDLRVLAGESVFKEDQTCNPLSGEPQYRIVTKGSCLDATGQRVIVGANFDITNLRLAEQHLQEALQQQKALTESTRDFIQKIVDVIPFPTYIRDASSRYQIVNEAFVRERGMSRDRILGHSPLELAPKTPQARRSMEEDLSVLRGTPLQKEEGGQHPATGELYFQLVMKGSCLDTQGKPVIVGINVDITDLRNSELQLKAALEQLQQHHQQTLDFVQRVVDLLPYPVYVKDAQSRYLMVNEAMARDHGMPREQLLAQMGLPAEIDARQMRALFEEDGRALAGERILYEDHGIHSLTGKECFRIVAKGCCINAFGDPVIVGGSVDLTELRMAERELKSAYKREVRLRECSLEFVQRLIDVIPDPVYIKKNNSQYVMVNSAFAEYHNLSKQELISPSMPLELGTDQAREISRHEDDMVLDGGEILKEEHTVRKATGEEIFRIVCKRNSVYFDGTPVIVGIDHHVTQWRLVERELNRLAMEDSLTGMSNRRHFQNDAQQALARARRHHEMLSLLMLDIDHFKEINDRWGHQAGDQVLVEMGQRILASMRNTDLPARWGGEEFVILMPHSALNDALAIGERLRLRMANDPVIVPNGEIRVFISIGVTQWEPEQSLEDLVARADLALNNAKARGRNLVVTAA